MHKEIEKFNTPYDTYTLEPIESSRFLCMLCRKRKAAVRCTMKKSLIKKTGGRVITRIVVCKKCARLPGILLDELIF